MPRIPGPQKHTFPHRQDRLAIVWKRQSLADARGPDTSGDIHFLMYCAAPELPAYIPKLSVSCKPRGVRHTAVQIHGHYVMACGLLLPADREMGLVVGVAFFIAFFITRFRLPVPRLPASFVEEKQRKLQIFFCTCDVV